MMHSLPSLPCPPCGTCAVPTLGPETGPHAAKAICATCGRFLKWVSRGLVEGIATMPCVNKVLLVGTISKYGVTVKYATSGTPCAHFTLVLTEQGQDGKPHSLFVDCEAWGKKA